ncbi:MAG: MmcQ/YjbR family DNA-binding protein [Acidimicrobiales bacterium]
MPEYADVAPPVVAELRAICMGLPDVYEEEAWTGVRWMVRKRTFAHVLTVEADRDSAHTRAASISGPTTLVTFRAQGEELAMLRHAGHPFFYAGWGRDVLGMVLDDGTDWEEVAELLTESYCVLAPKKLVALVDRPGSG